jgi:ribonuclease P protein component
VAERPSAGRTLKRRRLSRSAEFERVYRQGRSKANRFLVLYAFPREDQSGDDAGVADALGGGQRPARPSAEPQDVRLGPPLEARQPAAEPSGPRLGLSVSRRVGGAVDRTRVKRVLREAFWAEAARLPSGSDYVIVARPDARDLAHREGMPGIRAALAELVDAMGGGAAHATDAGRAPTDDTEGRAA